MNRFSYKDLSKQSTSLKVWRAFAITCFVFLVTIWSTKKFFLGQYEDALDMQELIEIDIVNDPLLVVAFAGTFNGSYNNGTRDWKGIRYGKCPERFAAPELADPLPPGEIYQNYNSPSCYTYLLLDDLTAMPDLWFAEDCLFLSISAPQVPRQRGANGYPVMVFFHGGAFMFGEGANSPNYDTTRFSKNGIIGVVVNYRLNIFGTFATQNESGNRGFEDQRVALKWVQQNIVAFGGDPSRVTIMGSSAGAQSVAAHLVSPASHGLYSAAIMGSWPTGFLYPTIESTRNVTSYVFEAAGCEVNDLACMRNIYHLDILKAQLQIPERFTSSEQLIFSMFVDPHGDLPIQPYIGIKNGLYPDVPLLVSFDRDEAVGWVHTYIKSTITPEEYSEYTLGFATDYMYVADKAAASAQLQELYPYTADTVDGRSLLNELVTDGMWACPTIHMLTGAVTKKKPNIYIYMFDHVYSDNLNSSMVWLRNSVPHTVDLECVFDAMDDMVSSSISHWNGTAAERQLCHNLNSAFSNFIQNGDPNNGRELGANMHWTSLTRSGDILIMNLDMEVGVYPRYDMCVNYWNAVQPIPGS